jgi:osmotically-inducible protein OsmY
MYQMRKAAVYSYSNQCYIILLPTLNFNGVLKMSKTISFSVVAVLALSSLLLTSGCTPVGMAAGTGAAVGVSAAREGGIRSTAKDLQIKALINDKWFKYDLNTFSKLNITVNQGRVLLTGVVQNSTDRVEAVRLAWQVDGVRQVINEIRVAEGEGVSGYIKDQWITTRLRTALTFNKDVQSINYTIDTVNGTVYLMGVAQNQIEIDRAIEEARTIPNVKQVVSYVKIAGPGDNRIVSEPVNEENLQE